MGVTHACGTIELRNSFYKRGAFLFFSTFFTFLSLSSLRYSLDFRLSHFKSKSIQGDEDILGNADPNLAFDLEELGKAG